MKRGWSIAFVFLFSIFIVSLVSANLTGTNLTAPAANANVADTYTFNATITGSATNVSFYWYNGTAASWKLLCYNSTSGAGPFTCAYDTTSLPDNSSQVFNVTAKNSTVTVTDNNTGIFVDNSAPTISIDSIAAGWHRQNLTIYANASDGLSNVTNSTMYFWFGNSTGNYSKTLLTSCGYISAATGFNCSANFNTTNLLDGNYTLWVNASDDVGNVKNQSLTLLGVDNTKPVVSVSCSPASIYNGDSFPCTCSDSDAISGLASTTTASTSDDGTGTPQKTGFFTYSCSAVDNAGNSKGSSTTYSVNQQPQANTGSGGGSSTSISNSKIHAFDEMVPGTVSVVKNFASGVGIKQIQIRVKDNANGVEIRAMKYDDRPAGVSVDVSGNVYQYLHIDTQNLLSHLANATITFEVNKSWVDNKSNIVVSKFNETAGKWKKLDTTYTGEDSQHYYYNATVDSFSYFAISEESAPVTTGKNPSLPETVNNAASHAWVWVLLILIIAFLLWMSFRKSKKR